MSSNNSGFDRRTVLRRSATALAASSGVAVTATPAAASDFEVGDCAHVDETTEVYAYGCPPGDQIGTATAGTCGHVEDVCDRYGTVYLDAAEGWLDESYLVHC
jgi:hypothetical protein